MQTITSKLFSAVRCGIIKSNKMFWDLYADIETIDELDAIIDYGGNKFNPKSKIKDYIVATNDGGFDMNEVLNPGVLKLEDLCKELGLIEEGE